MLQSGEAEAVGPRRHGLLREWHLMSTEATVSGGGGGGGGSFQHSTTPVVAFDGILLFMLFGTFQKAFAHPGASALHSVSTKAVASTFYAVR